MMPPPKVDETRERGAWVTRSRRVQVAGSFVFQAAGRYDRVLEYKKLKTSNPQ